MTLIRARLAGLGPLLLLGVALAAGLAAWAVFSPLRASARVPGPGAAPVSTSLVISQVYGGGGNSGATWRSDFIEIFNPASSAVSVNGWSVQYASATGSFSTGNLTMLTGSVQPYGYYLVKEADGANITTTMPLPTPDAVGTIAMSATAGKVALVNNTTAITSCPTGATIVDFIGYGSTASCFEGGAAAPGLSNTTAALRADGGCTDTDDNSSDFTAGSPNPRNSSSPINMCPGGATSTPTDTSTPGSPTNTPTVTPTRTITPTPTITLTPTRTPTSPTSTPTNTPGGAAVVRLYMLYAYGLAAGQTDEAVRLINLGGSTANIGNWQITNSGGGVITLPAGATLAAGQKIWIANQATSFRTYFGFNPDYEYGADTDPTVPNASATSGFAFSDSGTGVQLKDNAAANVDTVVYEGGSTSTTGWSGVAVQLYNFNIPNAGQIIYRQLDESTGLPVPDTNTSTDWAEDPNNGTPCDNIDCFKVLRPGWALTDPANEDMFFTKRFTETNVTTKFLVAPDNTFDAVHGLIISATTSITVEGYDWQAEPLVNDILSARARGVNVTIALDGNPTGGLDTDTLWAAQQWTNAGIPVYFFAGEVNTSSDQYRYNNMHQKFMIVDNTWLATGSENFALFGMPSDNKANGTKGNRGAFVITNAPDVVAYARRLFAFDMAPGRYPDVVLYPNAAIPTPPPGYTPTPEPDFTAYTVLKPTPLVVTETENIEIVQSPDNELRDQDSLVGLVNSAGAGDEVLVEQQYERKYWRTSTTAGPNPRLEAYIRAAQRGASVRILLDASSDDCTSATNNSATVNYVLNFGLPNLQARIGTPTSDNIHNKMVMVSHGGVKTVHISSINGSENSSKNNREFGLQITSSAAYQYYKDVFDWDWGRGFIGNCSMFPTPTSTSTPTSGLTNTPTPTATRTFTPAATPTPTRTPTITPTFTSSATNTPTLTPTSTPTSTLSSTPTLTATPAAGALLVGHVTWQGRAQPDARSAIAITLTLRLQAGGPDNEYTGMSTDASGYFTVTVGSLPTGDYFWRVKDPKYLAAAGALTLVGSPVTNVEMGLQKAGDANNDNVVNSTDFTLLKATFGKSQGQPGYDDRADFDGNQVVNAADFGLLKANFGVGGAPPVLPGLRIED